MWSVRITQTPSLSCQTYQFATKKQSLSFIISTISNRAFQIMRKGKFYLVIVSMRR